ncbi:transcriptional regulator [Cohnella xylanilytica]|uniref:Helix-turn-helix transcriptional regulator n=1 Tax=Cohnella xylanilytica TaxID=557555 RepID=A0A841UAQ3_9BACL|nr:helix-turn-helix domain-containing protein [Cohnella xylanilytica]MBB6695313.1 helix-turn-helix transcriptional regulator [Cohnella xylanilytica]GIO14738.1 transcriptional regulator [Cohnella xylanilytica]
MIIRELCTCPLEVVHDIIKGKWKTMIIYQLKDGNTSLAQLERDIDQITQKMLLQHLRELQSCGIVDKIKGEGYPLHVEYYLTERGKRLLDAVLIMQEIGIEYMVEWGQTELLDRKGIPYKEAKVKSLPPYPQKSG